MNQKRKPNFPVFEPDRRRRNIRLVRVGLLPVAEVNTVTGEGVIFCFCPRCLADKERRAKHLFVGVRDRWARELMRRYRPVNLIKDLVLGTRVEAVK